MDYQARHYAPRLGRFVSPDSIVPNPGNSQDLNRYSYVLGNPLRYHDPSGHQGGEPLNDFLQGFVHETTSNNLEALFIPATSPWRQGAEALAVDKNDNVAFQLGRLAGSVGTVVQGCAEMEAGVAMMAGGGLEAGATAPTVVGALPGIGVAVAGAGVAVHGASVAARGMGGVFESSDNIVNAITEGGGGSAGKQAGYYRSGKRLTGSDLKGATRIRRDVRKVKGQEFKDFIRSQDRSFRSREWKYIMETWEMPDGTFVENHYWRHKSGETWHHAID